MSVCKLQGIPYEKIVICPQISHSPPVPRLLPCLFRFSLPFFFCTSSFPFSLHSIILYPSFSDPLHSAPPFLFPLPLLSSLSHFNPLYPFSLIVFLPFPLLLLIFPSSRLPTPLSPEMMSNGYISSVFVPAGSKLNKNSLRSFPLSTRLISSSKLPCRPYNLTPVD